MLKPEESREKFENLPEDLQSTKACDDAGYGRSQNPWDT